MIKIDWCELLGWSEEQLKELRFTGYAYIRQGKFDIAMSFFEALVAVNPKSIYDVQTLGAIYLELGDPAKAMIYLEKSLELEPKHSATLLNKAKAYIKLDQVPEGLALLKKLKKDPDPRVSNDAKALALAFGGKFPDNKAKYEALAAKEEESESVEPPPMFRE